MVWQLKEQLLRNNEISSERKYAKPDTCQNFDLAKVTQSSESVAYSFVKTVARSEQRLKAGS